MGKTEVFLVELPFFNPRAGGKSFCELIAEMNDLGYVPYDFTYFLRRDHDQALGLCEVAFARKDGILRAFKQW